MTSKISVKKGEAKTITFTVTSAGVAVDLTGATLSFVAKAEKSDSVGAISKAHADFDRSDVATGVVKVTLSATDTLVGEGTYYGELEMKYTAANIKKSGDVLLIVEGSVI